MQYGVLNLLIKTNLTKCLTLREYEYLKIHEINEHSVRNMVLPLQQN